MLNDTSIKTTGDAVKSTLDTTAVSLPNTHSVSSPPPLCVQSTVKIVPSSNKKIGSLPTKTLATPLFNAAQTSSCTILSKSNDDGNDVTLKTIDNNSEILNLTDNLNNNISLNLRNAQQQQPFIQIDNIQTESNQSNDDITKLNLETNDKSIVTVENSLTVHVKGTTMIDTNLTNTLLPDCSKSPILSQPKTIRFPANGSRHTDSRTAGCCYWDDCHENCETSSNLLDHLQTKHVNPQQEPFSCRWANCKVHGRESCSRKWLERHVLSHGGSKLFKCIFEKCRMRFGSQVS